MVSKDGYLPRSLGMLVSLICTPCSDKPFHVEWVDLVRFNSQGKIAQMKEFFDSENTHNHLEEHESKTKDAK